MLQGLVNTLKTLFVTGSCLLIISCSCSNTAGVKGNGDLIAPKVSSTNPSKFKTKVSLNTFISVSFNEEMNSNSITQQSFYLKDKNKRLIPAEVFSNGKNSILKPSEVLEPFSSYSATVARKAADLNGNLLTQDYQWSFTTGNELDNTPPEVEEIIPGENEENVKIDSNLTVYFNELIDYTSINESSFRLENNAGTQITGSLEIIDNQIIFNPTEPFSFGTQYSLTLTTEIQDVSGNNLSSNFTNFFTTESLPDTTGPYVVNVYPKNEALNVASNSSISVAFDEELGNDATNPNNFLVTHSNGQNVSGIITLKNNTLFFTPSTEFSTKTQYTVSLKKAISDINGNPMLADFSWQFTTGDFADTSPPSVSFVMPEIDAVDVANNNAITVTFSEAIDPKTLGVNKFTVQEGNTYISGDIAYSGTTAIFKPNKIMANNTEHTVTIIKGVSDLAGNLTANDFTWSFTVGTERDNNIPRVSSVYPANDANSFAVNSSIIVRFTEAMNPSTLTPQTFYLQDSAGNTVDGLVVTIGASSSFKPLTSLNFEEQYTAFISNMAEDLAENTMAETYSWNFTTASLEDTISPSIISTVPSSASQQAAVNRGIIVSFSESIDAESINQESFYLTDTANKLIPGTVSVIENTATFWPNNELDYTKTYVVTLLKSITDLSGNPLNKIFSWNFTTSSQPDTVSPTVILTVPAENGLAAINHRLAIQFSEAMNTASLSAATVILTKLDNTEIPINVNIAERNAYITPINTLDFDTFYRIKISTGVKDLANNRMANEFILNFQTSLHPDLAPPFVVSTSPYSEEPNVLITQNPSIVFSEAINCITVTSDHFRILNNSIPIAGTVQCSVDSMTLTFIPNNPLPTQTTFTLQATTDIIDLSGDNLEAPYQSAFTTAAWTQQNGTFLSDQTFSITADSSNNLLSAGFTMGNFGAINAGSADIFITKHSKDSLLLWTQQFGSAQDDFATAVTTDNTGNVYITGYTYGDLAGSNQGASDIFIMKLDSNGLLLWQQQLGTLEDDAANSITLDNAGNILVAAYSFSSFDGKPHSGEHDIVTLKLDRDGNKLWSQQFGSPAYDIPNSIKVDSANNIYLTGYTEGTLNGNPNQGEADVFVSKLNTSGALQWTTLLGSGSEEKAQALTLDSDDNIIISGFTLGDLQGETNLGNFGADQFVAKIANDGTLMWYRQTGTTVDDRAYGVAVTAEDDIIVTGYTAGDMAGINAGKFDVVSYKLGADNGNTLWTTQLGTIEDDVSFALALDSEDNIYLGGFTLGNLDAIVNLGQQDFTLLKLNPAGDKQ